MIIEEKEQDDQSPRDDENTGSSGGLRRRTSDFSLSNAADVNPDNGEITPLKQEDGNITNDDIDQIECGQSCEGVDERNNPFDQHIYTHYVDKEGSPPLPKNITNSTNAAPQEMYGKSQTMKAPDVAVMFRDEFVKDTPSFVE